MRRWARLRTVAVCLFLGLGTTVAIAWTLAAAVRVDGLFRITCARDRVPAAGEGTGYVQVTRFERLGSTFFDSYVSDGGDKPDDDAPRGPQGFGIVVPGWARPIVDPWSAGVVPWPDPDSNDVRAVDFRGWPFRALWSEYRTATDEKYQVIAVPHGAIVLTGWSVQKGGWAKPYPVTLPLRPMWAGLAADTAIFGAAWWLPMALVAGWRRNRRTKRGLCAGCGYDLRATAAGEPCPECGAVPHAAGR